MAIDLSDGMVLDRERCTGCLACSTVCPSGALEAAVDCADLLKTAAETRQQLLVLGCSRNESSPAHYRLPCLGMLSPEHLLALSVFSKTAIQLDISGCANCGSSGMLPLLEKHFLQTEQLQASTIQLSLIRDAALLDYHSETVDRRGFFNSFRRMATQGAKAVLAGIEPETKPLSYADKLLPRRRKLLLSIKNSLPEKSLVAFTNLISFTEACSGCMGCVRACPTGALQAPPEQTEEPAAPIFNFDHCTGCGLCAEFCLDQAVRLN
jgi:formate hydrogenlyase subunit 6/NADH:ubiquinone oxidoreductase subunit I